MNRKNLIVAAAVVLALTSFGPAAHATHSWNNYHWARTSNPLPLQVVDSITSTWQSYFDTALSDWSKSNVLDLSITSTDEASKTRKRCPAITGEMRVCNASYGQNGWLGLATIGLDSNGHVDQGTAKMNDSYDSYYTPDERQHVICQEIGHVFGLGHTSEDGSSQKTCMDYSTDPQSTHPNQHDYDELSIIYQHLDSYDSYTGGTSGGGGGSCNAPPGKGCNKFGAPAGIPEGAVPVSRSVHHETWVKARGDGGLWIYEVYLAPVR